MTQEYWRISSSFWQKWRKICKQAGGKTRSAVFVRCCLNSFIFICAFLGGCTGAFALNSKTAEEMSRNLGKQTVLSGTVTRFSGNAGGSRQLQMFERSLMTVDELKSMLKGHFVVMKTGCHPMKTRLKLFFKWGIRFEEAYTVEEQAERKVLYADRAKLEAEILKKFPQTAESVEFEVYNKLSKKRSPKTKSMKRDCESK